MNAVDRVLMKIQKMQIPNAEKRKAFTSLHTRGAPGHPIAFQIAAQFIHNLQKSRFLSAGLLSKIWTSFRCELCTLSLQLQFASRHSGKVVDGRVCNEGKVP